MGRNNRLLIVGAALLVGVVLMFAFQNFSVVVLDGPTNTDRCYGYQFRQEPRINSKVTLSQKGIDPTTIQQYFPEHDPSRKNPMPAAFDVESNTVTLKNPGAPGTLVELRYCNDKSVALAPVPSR